MLKLPLPGSRLLVAGHHDLDGVVSAALAGAWLREEVRDCTIEYAIVDFDLGPRWRTVWTDLANGYRPWSPGLRAPPPDAVAVVDFPAPLLASSRIALYADHHPGSFDPETEQMYKEAERIGCPVFHGIGGSCAQLLLDMLFKMNGWRPSLPLAEAARLAHLVDTAGYATVAEALSFDMAGPASYDHWLGTRSPAQAALIAERLSTGGSLEAAIIGKDREEFDAVLEEARQTLARLDTSTGRVNSEVLVLDQTLPGRGVEHPVMFSEYQDPEVLYSVKLAFAEGHEPMVFGSIGRSPWAPPAENGKVHPDFGLIATAFGGGGGHPFAAGFRVVADSREQAARRARAIVQEMLPYLTPLAPGHRFAEAGHNVECSSTPVSAA